MDTEELLSHASQFDFDIERKQGDATYKDELNIKLRSKENGKRRWAIYYHGNCWDNEIKQFIYEPGPSNRDDEFLMNTRYSLRYALQIVEELSKNGF